MGDGGIAHVKICLKSNAETFEMIGSFVNARRCKYVLRKVESGEVKNLTEYDQAWDEAQEKIKE